MTIMTEAASGSESVNKWNTPEVQQLIQQHSREDLESHIYAKYLEIANSMHADTTTAQAQEDIRLAAAEAPLRVLKQGHWFPHEPDVNAHFLLRVDPATGEAIESGTASSRVWVAMLHEDGTIFEHDDGTVNNTEFSPEQIAIVYRHATELEEAGLIE